VLEAPAGEEEDLYEDVDQEEDGADDVQEEHCKGHGVFRDTLLFLIGLNLIRKTDRYVGADLSISNRRSSLLPFS
jgi:hypothetical protein